MPTRWCAGQGNTSGNDPTRVAPGFGGVGRGKGADQEELEAGSREPDTRPGLHVERTATSASKSLRFDAKYSR